MTRVSDAGPNWELLKRLYPLSKRDLKPGCRAMPAVNFRDRRWLVPVSTVAFTAVAAAVIFSFRSHAENAVKITLTLSRAEQLMAQLDGIEENAIRHGSVPEDLQEIEAIDQQLKQLWDNLSQSSFNAQQLAQLQASSERYGQALRQEIRFLQAGDLEAAEEIDDGIVDPEFARIAEMLQAGGSSAIQQAKIANREADIGTMLSLVLAALCVSIVVQRLEQARRKSELAATEQLLSLEREAALRHERDQLEQRVQARTQELEGKNKALTDLLDQLQATQQELIQAEKMAALCFFNDWLSNEIYTPLGAIQAASGNLEKALAMVMTQLPELSSRLTSEQQQDLFDLLDRTLHHKPLLSSREKRPLRKQLQSQLESANIPSPRQLADRLLDLGAYDSIDRFLPILQDDNREWSLQLAYNFNRLHGNRKTIQNAVERASKIVFSLKNYTRVDHNKEPTIVHVLDGIETVLSLYHNQLKRGIELVTNYDSLPDIQGYPDELIQVWTNLIHNAIHAMTDAGTLTLSTQAAADQVVVQISDTGHGIDPAVRDRIFEPFFTTKPQGEGSGLGLHIVRNIIEKHQGDIQVASQPGKTVFTVKLPISFPT